MKQRIWELDALRGFMIVCMIFVHLVFDLEFFLGLTVVSHPALQYFFTHSGFLFVVLSGICVTIGSKSIRRGLLVLGFALVITAVTVGMWLLDLASHHIIIYFGVLHLLGVCMLLWPFFKKLPTWALIVPGAALVAAGLWVETIHVDTSWLIPLGLRPKGFSSSDYYPLLPHLGWFLLGAALGRPLYKEKKTRLPWKGADSAIIRFFCFCGRQSIWIYLLHQPILYGMVMLFL